MQTPLPDRAAPLAAIDLGSNSFRLEIGQVVQGRYRRIDYWKQMVRLGGGLDAAGRLSDDAMQRGLTCLRLFAGRLRGFSSTQVRAVATQTLREARNRDVFLERAHGVLGHEIEVVSGREEARLIYAGVAHLQPSDDARLVIDIGGRSTEMILAQGALPTTVESFQIGCVGLSMRYFDDGRLDAERFRAAQVAAGAELEEGLQPFAPHLWQVALGSSGTAGAVSQVLAAANRTDGRITAAGLRWCIERCIDAGRVDRIDFPGLKPERRSVMPGGLSILYTLLTQFGIDALWPAKGALRQGVIVDLHSRLEALRGESAEDMRDRTAAELQARFAVDIEQATRVRAVALRLFDAVCADAPTLIRRELGWACDLHEIGQMVSHHDHHRHSAYLLANVDAPGFSQSEQSRIGDLVIGQRGGLRKVEGPMARKWFAWQLLCLRLAVIECHARAAIDQEAMQLRVRDGQARLSLDPAWADKSPRTLFLLHEEASTWARGRALKLVIERPRD